jgi:hypothetical protein
VRLDARDRTGDAILADTGHIKSEISALGDMIEQTGKRLTTIYITHGHLDHFLGIGPLMQRFPSARPVSTPAIVADIKASVAEQEKQWQRRFGDDVDKTAVIPEPPEGHVIDLEGQELRVMSPRGTSPRARSSTSHRSDTVIGGDLTADAIIAGDYEILADDTTRSVKSRLSGDLTALYPLLAAA